MYAKALLFGAQNRRKQLLFLALTFKEQNAQRQLRQSLAQLATATWSRKIQWKAGLWLVLFHILHIFLPSLKRHKTNQGSSFVFIDDRAKMHSYHKKKRGGLSISYLKLWVFSNVNMYQGCAFKILQYATLKKKKINHDFLIISPQKSLALGKNPQTLRCLFSHRHPFTLKS